MKIRAIELTNYGPFYGTHHFELAGRGLVAVLGDNRDEPRMNSNGSGKSSLIEALDWCLFPVVPRGDNADSVVNDDAAGEGQGCRVRVFAEDGDDALIVERTRKFDGGSGLRLVFNGEDVSALDAKETQKFVEFHLGVDRQVFHATVLFAQSDMFKFADASDSERIEILTKILRLELIDAWLESAKQARRLAEQKRFALDQAHAALQGQIDALEKFDSSAQAAHFEAQRSHRLKALEDQRLGAESQLREVEARVGDLAELQARLVAATEPREPAQLLAVRGDLTAAQASKEAAIGHREVLRAEARRLRGLANLPPVCGACGQAVAMAHRADAEQAAHHIETVEGPAALTVVGQWEAYIVQIRASEAAVQKGHMELVRAYHVERAQMVADLNHRRQAAGQAEECKRRLAQLRTDARHEIQQPNPFVEQQAKVASQIAVLRSQVGTSQQQVQAVDADMSRIDFWCTAFGPKGLKSYILDARMQEMTESANAWAKLLTGGTYWVRLETQTALKTGALRNRFNVRVFNSHHGKVHERNYKSWSGGQKQRISLAIDFGLSRLIAKRAQKSYDLLILDEIFKHLDSAGRDAVMEMLQVLKSEKSTILVVDHDAEFVAQFEERIVVRMENGRATLHEGDAYDQQQPAAQSQEAAEAPQEPQEPEHAVPTRTPVKARPNAAKPRPRRKPRGGKRPAQARGRVGAGDD